MMGVITAHPGLATWAAVHLGSCAYVWALVIESDREFAAQQGGNSMPADPPWPARNLAPWPERLAA